MSCWHCNACMIICWKGMAFVGHCKQSGTHQWGSTKKIQVKHDLRRRLYGGQGQNKIGGAHLHPVGIAMHEWQFVEKAWLLLGAARKVVPISKDRWKQGNSVARDLPRTGSETNTTTFVIYILDIDSHCPYLLSVETTFQLTSCQNSLHVYLRFGETTSHLTSKWRGTFQYFQSHDKIPYVNFLMLEIARNAKKTWNIEKKYFKFYFFQYLKNS